MLSLCEDDRVHFPERVGILWRGDFGLSDTIYSFWSLASYVLGLFFVCFNLQLPLKSFVTYKVSFLTFDCLTGAMIAFERGNLGRNRITALSGASDFY